MQGISKKVIDNAMDYDAYRNLIHQKFAENYTTSGENSEEMLHYTDLNIARMKRLDRTIQLVPETIGFLEGLERPLIWLVITEGWCGDAAQILPVVNTMANQSDKITLKLILRDQHLDIMDAFLTNGTRAIPILLILDANTLEVLGTWGPRPTDAQGIISTAKAESKDLATVQKESAMEAAKITLHKWYTKDKGFQIQQEIIVALQALAVQLEGVG